MPTFGTGVFVIRKEGDTLKFLIQQRGDACKRGAGCWALPGGMIEDLETIAKSAEREVLEESGLVVRCAAYDEFQDCALGISDHRPRDDHYTIWVAAEYLDGEAQIKEPTKCKEYRWVTPAEFFAIAKQEGEQVYWAPVRVWRTILERLGFPQF